VFVGGFIGSPAMNLRRVRLSSDGPAARGALWRPAHTAQRRRVAITLDMIDAHLYNGRSGGRIEAREPVPAR
jgi:hypothetical protein